MQLPAVNRQHLTGYEGGIVGQQEGSGRRYLARLAGPFGGVQYRELGKGLMRVRRIGYDLLEQRRHDRTGRNRICADPHRSVLDRSVAGQRIDAPLAVL